MKKQLLNRRFIMVLAILSAGSFTGCGNDDANPVNTDPTTEVGFAISTVSGAWPNFTTYIQLVPDLDFSNIDNDKAIELTNSGSTTHYGGNIYAMPFGAPATLVKYFVNSDSIPEEEQRIVVPGANTFSALYFESETKAYATVAGGISKLIVFDPSTMRIEDELNLSQISKRFPEATRTYYQDMVERDGKLFMGVYYENNFAPVNDSAYVAVIDLTTSTFQKLLSDGRTGMVFGGPSFGSGIAKDANGNIYIQAKGTLDYGGETPSGILRIKSGETEFDANYFFDLTEAMGGIGYGIYHFGEGLTFTTHNENTDDFWELNGGPYYQYYKIDLESQSAAKVEGIPNGFWSNRLVVKQLSDNEIFFTVGTGSENAVYGYDIATGKVTKKFSSTGGAISGLEAL